MAYKFNIKKQHWKRYQIIQKKFCQYQYYGIDRMGKHEIGKEETSEY